MNDYLFSELAEKGIDMAEVWLFLATPAPSLATPAPYFDCLAGISGFIRKPEIPIPKKKWKQRQ